MASAKQLAARRKFAAIMKSGGFKKRKTKSLFKATVPGIKKRKSLTTKRKSTPLKRATPRKRTMVKRRTKIARRSRNVGRGIGSSLKTGIIGEVVKGIGAGSLVGLVMSRVAPNSSITPIASTGAAFLAGGLTGGIAQVVLSGGLSSFGSIFGGASKPQQEFGV
jgi:hypothetical protein